MSCCRLLVTLFVAWERFSDRSWIRAVDQEVGRETEILTDTAHRSGITTFLSERNEDAHYED
jgi:hypothetical protein